MLIVIKKIICATVTCFVCIFRPSSLSHVPNEYGSRIREVAILIDCCEMTRNVSFMLRRIVKAIKYFRIMNISTNNENNILFIILNVRIRIKVIKLATQLAQFISVFALSIQCFFVHIRVSDLCTSIVLNKKKTHKI